MILYDKIYNMNAVFGIWQYNKRIRITYVSPGWFVVWDHQESPPIRYDCRNSSHHEACTLVINMINELTAE